LCARAGGCFETNPCLNRDPKIARWHKRTNLLAIRYDFVINFLYNLRKKNYFSVVNIFSNIEKILIAEAKSDARV
jgi:hypothetical protein